MAMEFGHVTCHLEYMNSVLNAMYEAWDDLLFKLDSQLASYSQVRDHKNSREYAYSVFAEIFVVLISDVTFITKLKKLNNCRCRGEHAKLARLFRN